MLKVSHLFFGLFLFLFSCTKSEAPKDIGSLQQLNLPEWVIDPSVDGMISAVGISPKTAGGIKMQIAQAEADAIGNMASQIQTTVSRITKDSLRRASVATQEKTTEAVDGYFAQATKSIVKNVPISGAKRKNIFKDPSTGDLYIQMVLDQSVVKQYLLERTNSLAQGMKDFNTTQSVIAQTENAMKDLFNEVDFSEKTK